MLKHFTEKNLRRRTSETRVVRGGVSNVWYQITNSVAYTYDNASELTSANGSEANGTPRALEQFGYAYDAAGNLNNRTNDALVQTFAVNNLNELNTVARNGPLTVEGTTTSSATNVTVNTSNAVLYADYTFASTNQNAVNGTNTFTAIAKDGYGRISTNVAVVNLLTNISYVYDLNGNLRTNGTRTFDYDDENELIRVTESNAWKSEFVYDGKMRRRIRREYQWAAGSSGWLQTNEVHYVYDRNLVIQERDINNLPLVSYTRGTDLSGSLQGAGGIGGLLAFSQLSTIIPQHSYYHADGNGNITALVNANQSLVAKYLYDSYGNTLSASGPLANVNLYQFSSKEIHPSSGLYYYGFRYYGPSLQRWPNRDPRNELGFLGLRMRRSLTFLSALDREVNSFAFVRNEPLDKIDAYGLAAGDVTPGPSFPSGGGANDQNPGTLGGINQGNFPDCTPSQPPNPCKNFGAIQNVTPTTSDGDIQCFQYQRCDFESMGSTGGPSFGWRKHTGCINLSDGPIA
jgi:RHS repeat-associated protein